MSYQQSGSWNGVAPSSSPPPMNPNYAQQSQSRPSSSGQSNSPRTNNNQQFPRQSQAPPNNRHSSFNALEPRSSNSNSSNPRPTSPSSRQPLPPPSSSSQQQPESHRRTQSMRPMSAFQPMESSQLVTSPSLGGNAYSNNRPSSPNGSVANSIAVSTRSPSQPLTFKSQDLRAALALQEAQSAKIYMEGYLSKRDECGSDGKPLHPNDEKRRWNLCFVQLSGTVMSIWSVKEMDKAAKEGREVPPSYINITDSFADYVGSLTEDPAVVPGSRGRYENVFALNSAGANRMFFCVEGQVGRRLVQAWVNAIRLASWEKVRLEEIYTGALIRARLGAALPPAGSAGPEADGAPPTNPDEPAVKSPLIKGKMEGWVKARFMGSTEWKKAWLVISSERPNGLSDPRGATSPTIPGSGADKADTESISGGSKKKFWKLGGAGDRSSILSLSGLSPNSSPTTSASTFEDLPLPPPPPGANESNGTALFYENKKSKKPFAMMTYVRHVFAVYPSRAELVEGSSLCKVEGAFSFAPTAVKEGEFKIPRSATARPRETGWCMLMPENEFGGSKGQNAEMMKWVVATMDCFGLYGRPRSFIWDARSPLSAFFAYPIGPYKDRLFLDRELAEFLDVREERHLASRSNLHGIMAARMRGERTPILPPLPTPKGLSEVKKADSAGAKNGNGATREEDEDDDAPLGGGRPAAAAAPALPDFAGGLPPLDFGNSDDSNPAPSSSAQQSYPQQSQQRDAQASNGTNDSAFGRQLSSIGERSREGSAMTSGDRVSGHDRGESVASMSSLQKPLPRVTKSSTETSSSASTPPPPPQAQAQALPAPVSQIAYAPSQRSNGPPSAITEARDESVVSPSRGSSTLQVEDKNSSASTLSRNDYPETNPRALPQLAPVVNGGTSSAGPASAAPISAAPSDPSVYSQVTRTASIASQARSPAVLAPSGRGAEAEPASGAANGNSNQPQRRESGSSYDEGALFYMNSISDQLPAQTSQTQAAPRRAPSQKQLQQPSNEPTIEKRAISPVASQSAPQPTLRAEEPQREPKLSPPTQENSIGDDALAAYSFLEKPPSPMIKQKSLSRSERSVPETASNSTSAHTSTPATRPPAQAFPSSFVNKRAAERKEAAEASAKAHQEALSKPGRAAGKGKKAPGFKKGHAWGEESSEDEDEDEEEEEEEDDEEEEQKEKLEKRSHSQRPSVDATATRTRSRSSSQNGGGSISGQPIFAPPQSMYGGYPQMPVQMQQPGMQPGMMPSQMMAMYGGGAPPSQMDEFAGEMGAPKPWANQSASRDASPQRGGSHPALRQSVFNSHLGIQHSGEESRSSTPPSVAAGRSPAGSIGAAQGRGTFINLKEEEQPGQMTAVFQPHGLLQAGAADKAERSAKSQEAEARSQGGHLVNVPNKPPPPQAGLLGAITAHERDRKGAGGFGATLTERERERVNAERRGREEEEQSRMFQAQQQQQMQQMAAMGMNPQMMNPQMMGFNPYMFQQMQMMYGMGGMGGQMPGWGGSQMGQPQGMDPMMAQQQAMMAAQQAYAQAMSQVGGQGPEGSIMAPPASMAPGGSPSTRPQSMAMPQFMGGMQSPPMSFYGGPPMGAYQGFMQPPQASEFGHASPRGSYGSPGGGSPSMRPAGNRSREPSNQ